MCKKNILLLLLAFSPFFVFGNGSSPLRNFGEAAFNLNDTCDLPAPTNFQVVAIGANWARLTWTPQASVSHRVRTYKAVGNILISDTVMTAAQIPDLTLIGLESGTVYFSTINPICPDGTDGKYQSFSGLWEIIIADLIVAGIQESSNNPTCNLVNVGQYCEFPIDGSRSIFKVRYISSGAGRFFNVRKVFSPKEKLRGIVDSPTGVFYFRIDGQVPTAQGVEGVSFQIFVNGNNSPIATFELSEHNPFGTGTIGRLTLTHIASGYEIVRLTSLPNGLSGPPSSGAADRGDDASVVPQLATASPNPFSESLQVTMGQATEGKVCLRLYSLEGQIVREQQFDAGQERFALSTAGLSAGFYLLRIEADGKSQTLKVIKSE